MADGDRHPGGRPTKFRPEFVDQAKKLCRLGATDAEMADFFEVDESTINRWKSDFPEFCESIKKGKTFSDATIADSLYHRAKGYSHEAVKILSVSQGAGQPSEVQQVPYIEHFPPDTTAGIFWLKNRQPAKWRDKHDVDVNQKLTVDSGDAFSRLAALLDGSAARLAIGATGAVDVARPSEAGADHAGG